MAKPVVLTISGHDPTGGAGIQADIEAIIAAGCRPVSAITCLTVQDTTNVHRVEPTTPQLLDDQIRTLLADLHIAVIKVGLIPDAGTLNVISQVLRDHPTLPTVLDPVLTSGAGSELTVGQLIDRMTDELLPRVTLLTPNSLEARRLGGSQELQPCAQQLLVRGCQAVLITGTHEAGEKVRHHLYQRDADVINSSWPRLPGSYHGSGCTLASSIAGLMAHGERLENAVHKALEYTWNSLAHSERPGHGQLLPDRIFALRRPEVLFDETT
ncbi:MAG: hydroxymethylpyrimidine/phosphomethylpyrimidine kinase [Gammaproteobacteria bacterium]|nr:hydroxymethylpyrimidine/phosphomethylpyrimidine kinase [Gammaproteobacteria bacterium]MCP5418359.1 hydroxymethylpyrimidine/phosphomethylpyrimidine kinase [Chromatiaceae bacterium]